MFIYFVYLLQTKHKHLFVEKNAAHEVCQCNVLEICHSIPHTCLTRVPFTNSVLLCPSNMLPFPCKLALVLATILGAHCPAVVNAWNLSNLGLSPSDYIIEHVSVFYVRAFLCIRRAPPSSRMMRPTVNNNYTGSSSGRRHHRNAQALPPHHILPSLVEVPWPEPQPRLQSVAVHARIYPSDLDHARHNDRECNGIIGARATAVNMHTGDLWVLDGGSRFCAPKLIEYDLIGRNEETHRFGLGDFRHTQFSTVHIIGPEAATTANNGSSSGDGGNADKRLVLTVRDAEADFLVVYATAKRRWWKLKLM